MPFTLFSLLVLMAAGVSSKPVDPPIDGHADVIDDGTYPIGKNEDRDALSATTTVTTDSIAENANGSSTSKPSLLTWFLAPLSQNLQFSPQSFLRDRVVQLKETLENLRGPQVERGPDRGKQLGTGSGLLQVAGANDGFYTNRLEPVGFFGGNGWLANKGGIVGGPGAILSTGSILTDYPSPYRRK
ncbi:uncharacterized protein LOC117224318 [Megalopta genalis]|uniref:uncharacterized protein LOC117224318 n=1 Tax=Megalopta genalis TaxID=115081 RepID=UPI00144342BE|nr:uncharacterized protein LOC117224318 [Megalopta genalis]